MTADRCRRALRALGLAVLVPVLAACGLGGSEPESASSVFDLEVGHCFDDDTGTGEVADVDIVDCDEPHRFEVYARGEMDDDGAYPGTDAVEAAQARICLGEAFEEFTGAEPAESTLHLRPLGPTTTSWEDLDDREILCAAFQPGDDGEPEMVTGSLEGSDAR